MIRDYQTLMSPLLQLIADGKEHEFKKIINVLGRQFNLTEDERSELLPSGQSFLFSK